MTGVKVHRQSSEEQSRQTQPGESRQASLARREAFFPSWVSRSPSDVFSMSPFSLMRWFTDEMDRIFERSGWRGSPYGELAPWTPAVEVTERDGNLVVCAELPGLNKEDVKVDVTDEGLVIQGERKREHEERHGDVYRSERSYGQFYRAIPLPEGANVDKARAQFNNGVLEVTIPIPESHRRRQREIPVEVK
jgi:HSP20 family protein